MRYLYQLLNADGTVRYSEESDSGVVPAMLDALARLDDFTTFDHYWVHDRREGSFRSFSF